MDTAANAYVDTVTNPVTTQGAWRMVLCVDDTVAALRRGTGTEACLTWRNDAPPPPPAAAAAEWLGTLTSLTLQHARLDVLPTAVLHVCRALTSLDLAHNLFTRVPHHFVAQHTLVSLCLAHNALVDASHSLASLRHLDVRANPCLVSLPALHGAVVLHDDGITRPRETPDRRPAAAPRVTRAPRRRGAVPGSGA